MFVASIALLSPVKSCHDLFAMISYVVLNKKNRRKFNDYRKIKRRQFSPEIIEMVMKEQYRKYNNCGMDLKNYDFDHMGSSGR